MSDVLDRYLDEALDAAERARFEHRLAADPALASELALERRIRAGLRTRFRIPPAPGAAALSAVRRASRRARLARWTRVAAAAAALLTLYLGARGTLVPPPAERLALSELYASWNNPMTCELPATEACSSGDEFTVELALRHGRGLWVAPGRSLRREDVPAPWSGATSFVAHARGVPVFVFVVSRGADRGIRPQARDGVFLHRRELEDLVLFEISPFTLPVCLDAFSIPPGPVR